MILPPDFANASPSWQESIYNQSHRLPERALARETPQHSWQPTLVNDACLTVLEQQFVSVVDSAKQLDVMERDDAMQSADHCER